MQWTIYMTNSSHIVHLLVVKKKYIFNPSDSVCFNILADGKLKCFFCFFVFKKAE